MKMAEFDEVSHIFSKAANAYRLSWSRWEITKKSLISRNEFKKIIGQQKSYPRWTIINVRRFIGFVYYSGQIVSSLASGQVHT
jgi:hypothetical protein